MNIKQEIDQLFRQKKDIDGRIAYLQSNCKHENKEFGVYDSFGFNPSEDDNQVYYLKYSRCLDCRSYNEEEISEEEHDKFLAEQKGQNI